MSLPDSRAARSAIFAALRSGTPAGALPPPDLTPYLAGPYGRGSLGPRIDPATLITPFESAARSWRAEVQHAEPGSWPETVRSVLARRGCTRVAIGAAGPLQGRLASGLEGLQLHRFEQPLDGWKTEFFDTIDAGITSAEAGIADTGTLLLRPGVHEPRTLSLVPPLHIAVLMASRLYASLPAAMQALAPQADMPSNLLLVTGPSKTSDIQQTLAFGAHGPKALVIVLVNDLPAAGAPR